MPTEPFHRLFFAIRPPIEVIPEIAWLRDSLGQDRQLVSDDRLHLTTWLFPDSRDFLTDAAARARAAMTKIPRPTFHIVLDKIVGGHGHVLLLPSEPLKGFIAFQAELDRALRATGLAPRKGWRFNPHLTLLHGRHEIDQPIDAISWVADDIVLIDSIVGRGRHDLIARWVLE